MQYRLLDGVIDVPDGFVDFMTVKRRYLSLSGLIAKKLDLSLKFDEFYEAVGHGDRPSNEARDWLMQIALDALSPLIESMLQTLRDQHCYQVDREMLLERYFDLTPVEECVGEWVELMVEAENAEWEKELHRRARTRRFRSMWVGGTLGGGIKGALKGAMKAELMNLAGGALSGIYNKFERSRSLKQANENLEKMFIFCEAELIAALRETVGLNAKVHAKILNEYCGFRFETEWDSLDEEKASALFANFKEGLVPKSEQKHVLLDIVRANPFDEEFYGWLYVHKTIPRTTTEKLAEFFCVPLESVKNLLAEVEREKKERIEERKRERERKTAAEKQARSEAERTLFGRIWASVAEKEAARCDRLAFFDCVESLFCRYDGQDGFAGTRLTAKKLAKIQAVFETLPEERVLWLMDTSFFYNAGYGLIVTDRGFRWKNRKREDSKVTCLSWKKFGEGKQAPYLNADGMLVLCDGAFFDVDVNFNWKEKWMPVYDSLWHFWQEATFEKKDVEMSQSGAAVSDRTIGGDDENSSGSEDVGESAKSVKDIILKAVEDAGGGVYCLPNIPDGKLVNAKLAMAVPTGEMVVALMDTTFFGSAKTGAVLTDWGVRWANDWTTDSQRTALSWKELSDLGPFRAESCTLIFSEGIAIATAGGGMSAEKFKQVIEKVALRLKGIYI